MEPNANLTGQVTKVNLSLDGYYNSTIGKVSLAKAKIGIPIVEGKVKSAINGRLNKGFGLQNILANKLGITFVDISDIALTTGEHFMQLSISPTYNLNI